MAIFEDIELGWDGRDYRIPSNKVMRAIAAIEDVITLDEVQRYAERGTAPLGKIACAYATALRFAGARVSDDEVYSGMFKVKDQAMIITAISGLLTMMVPPDVLKDISVEPLDGDQTEGNSDAPSSKGASSKKRTRSQ